MPGLTGADVATAALAYRGIPYRWGGHLPSTGWDCSGFAGYVLGHDLGLALPGGFRWSARSHGPIAAAYKVWGKASTTGAASPGTLCCWLTHIGIAVSGTQMISAYDTQLGTAVTGFTGPPGEPLSFRQINLVSASGGATLTSARTGCLPAFALMPLLLLREVRHGHEGPGPGHR